MKMPSSSVTRKMSFGKLIYLLQIFGQIEQLFPELLKSLSDPSDEVSVKTFLPGLTYVMPGLKITASQRTMSGLIRALPG